MEKYFLEEDVKVFCVPAVSFPDGIKPAFDKLKALTASLADRDLFGISYAAAGSVIIYKAAAQQLFECEGEKYGCEVMVLKKGEYLTETIRNWEEDVSRIGKTFQQLLADPSIDQKSFCVEWYKNKTDVMCMVRLDPVLKSSLSGNLSSTAN